MREQLEIDPMFQELFRRLQWKSCVDIARCFSLAGSEGKSAVRVLPHTLAPPGSQRLDVYYKQYDYPTPTWRFLGRCSKARCEFHNYAVFKRLGIRCAQRIACGEQRTLAGRLRRAFIITQAVPQAMPLLEFVQELHRHRSGADYRGARQSLVSQLAQMTRAIHQAGFFHNDLVWRNILVTPAPDGSPMVWWIDCPRGHFVRPTWRQARFRIKDLASLDKSAARWCSRTMRLRFLLAYLEATRLRPEVKQWIRNILAYRRKRWPDDWA